MAANENQNELEMLRTEVAALKKEREEKAFAAPEKEHAFTSSSDMNHTEEEGTLANKNGEESTDLKDELQELVEILDTELKNTSPMTLLIVFALGLLLGRLLPR